MWKTLKRGRNNKVKNKYHTIGRVPTFNRKIVEMKGKTKKYPNVGTVRKEQL
jgi:hypothetical protein